MEWNVEQNMEREWNECSITQFVLWASCIFSAEEGGQRGEKEYVCHAVLHSHDARFC